MYSVVCAVVITDVHPLPPPPLPSFDIVGRDIAVDVVQKAAAHPRVRPLERTGNFLYLYFTGRSSPINSEGG